MIDVIRKADGSCIKVIQGSTARVTVTFDDFDDNDFNKASILTLEATLKDLLTDAIINLRDAQNIKDANGGTLTVDGTLTLFLGPDDNPNVGTEVGDVEQHLLVIEWTWTDGTTTHYGDLAKLVEVLCIEAAA